VVTLGRSDLGGSRVDPFCWYLSYNLEIVLWDTLKILGTAVWDSTASNRLITMLCWASLRRGATYVDRLVSRDETDFTPENSDF
jgi:hypothetical protein